MESEAVKRVAFRFDLANLSNCLSVACILLLKLNDISHQNGL